MSLTTPAVRRRSILTGPPLALVAALSIATGVAAQGAAVHVAPAALPVGPATLTVSGTGFDPAGNGIYVVFGPITPAPGFYMDPSIYGSFKWVHAGANESPAEAPLAADGSFSTTLEVASTFASGGTQVDCAVTTCAVITFAAHGSPDRSQDTCTPLLVGGVASGATSAEPGATSASPGATSASPGATSASPGATSGVASWAVDPCAPITGGGAPGGSGAPGDSPSPSVAAGASSTP